MQDCAEREAALERHIEPRERTRGRDLYAREIMNGIAGRADQARDFLEAAFSTPDLLERGPCDEPAIVDREQQGVQYRKILVVKRAIDENRAPKGQPAPRGQPGLPVDDDSNCGFDRLIRDSA